MMGLKVKGRSGMFFVAPKASNGKQTPHLKTQPVTTARQRTLLAFRAGCSMIAALLLEFGRLPAAAAVGF